MATNGLYTSDNIPAQQLYTEHMRDIGLYNQTDPSFLSLFCTKTTKKTVRVSQQGMRFSKAGEMGGSPLDRTAYREFTLSDPVAYEAQAGFTKQAFERGVSADEIADQVADAKAADNRLIQEAVIKSMMNDGGFWDASMSVAPPDYKMNTFTTSHEHYFDLAQSGTPILANFTAMQSTIVEHGYGLDGGLVVFMNNAQATAITNAAEWLTTSNYVSTPAIAQLQSEGIINGPTFNIVGIPVSVNDWVPANYILMVDVNAKPCHWRETEVPAGRGLVTDLDEGFHSIISGYRRYVSCKVTKRSAGAVMYVNNATWADPTGWTI